MNVEPGSGVSDRWVRWRRAVDLADYDRRWEEMNARGESIHGEMDFIERLVSGRISSILDAGCGTGRLAIEAVRRGHRAVGVDLDPDMIDRARSKAPEIEWFCSDLSHLELDDVFDVIVMAGNIPLFCAPGSQASIISSLTRHLGPGGTLVCGFSIEQRSDAYLPEDFRRDAESAGLDVIGQYANWDGEASRDGDDYAVIVCRAAITSPSIGER